MTILYTILIAALCFVPHALCGGDKLMYQINRLIVL